MGELSPRNDSGNVNVTLGDSSSVLGPLMGMEFPCPLCGAGLPILASKRKKPYCTCNKCGVQIFVRGKEGIARLRDMASRGILISGTKESASRGINLYNRLEQLKLQKRELEAKGGIFFRADHVENAIQIVDAEIEKVQGELAKIASKVGNKNK
jgi:DNA-directed RNA polymerase subunit RPC12/RpoP